MNLRQKHISSVIALLLVFSIAQVYVSASSAGPQPSKILGEDLLPATAASTGILTTQGNKPIIVNGESATSGATMVSGAGIETPPGVRATVNLPNLGSVQIEPDTRLMLEFRTGLVKVMVTQGCVTLRTKKGTVGQVNMAQGIAGSTDSGNGIFRLCPSYSDTTGTGTTGSQGQGATSTGAQGGAGGAAGSAGGGLFGIGVGETVALVALTATFALSPVFDREGNPSPSAP